MVSTVHGSSKSFDDSSEYDRSKKAMIEKLRQRYGKDEFRYSEGMGTHIWENGKRHITLTYFMDLHSFNISCTDKDLYESVERSKPPVDTRGL